MGETEDKGKHRQYAGGRVLGRSSAVKRNGAVAKDRQVYRGLVFFFFICFFETGTYYVTLADL